MDEGKDGKKVVENGGPLRSNDQQQPWPVIVWFVMKFSGIFYHDRIVRQKKCLACDMEQFEKRNGIFLNSKEDLRPIDFEIGYNVTSKYESTLDCSKEEKNAAPKGSKCVACQSCWWNRDGYVAPYTDSSIGVTTWNHSGSWLLSIIIIFATIGLLVNELRRTIQTKFGQPTKLLQFLSYSAFLCTVSVVPIMSLCSKLRSALGGSGPGKWATAINARFIVQRLQFLHPQTNGYPGKPLLVACLVWPVICATYRCYVIIAVQKKQNFESLLTCTVGAISQFTWGCFLFLIYLMRLSFQIQLDLVLRFLKTMEGQTEICQRILHQVTVDFRCFSHCVRIYTTAVIPLCVLGITTNLTWQYMVFSLSKDKQKEDLELQKNINIMIWLEITMFVCLTPIAIGGFDPNHVWEKFHINVHCMQSSSEQEHWNQVLRYLKHVGEKSPTISFSMILSVVGFYMAVQFGKQDVFY